MLRGELVSENSREEPVSLKCSDELVTIRARPSVLRRELVSENSGKEPSVKGSSL